MCFWLQLFVALKGAATLKARTGCKNRLNAPVLPLEDNNDIDFDFEKCRSVLANGTELHVETPDGNFRVRSVSIILSSKAKVILKLRKLNILKGKKESRLYYSCSPFFLLITLS